MSCWPIQRLSDRQRAFIRMHAEGCKTSAIARHFGVCPEAVRSVLRSEVGQEELIRLNQLADDLVIQLELERTEAEEWKRIRRTPEMKTLFRQADEFRRRRRK